MNKLTNKLVAVFFAFALVFTGCDALDFSAPDKTYQGSEVGIKFTDVEPTLFAEADEDTQNLSVSTLRPLNTSRTYNFIVVDTLTNAVEGTHYTLASNSFTIEANEVLGVLPVTLIKAGLGNPVELALEIVSEERADFNTIVVAELRQFNPYDQANFVGTWDLVYPWYYGNTDPQIRTVIAGSDENTIILLDIFGTGVDIEIDLDDTDKTNFVSSVATTAGAWSHPAGPVSVSASGTFSAAPGEETISMRMAHVIPGVGTFGPATPLTLTKQ